ncbi:MAG TPA: HisA/HisF-related TIM barrel protein [Gemmataceae bacterium]|nr:HisA/HisF-related TIM barrel protein [Gemmataceae bacterium]
MRIIPVMDVKDGMVVRGVGGRREDYRPITSHLTSSSLPIDVARAFRDRLGLPEIYLADLDAIGGKEPALKIYGDIQSLGCRLWVDAGIRDADDAQALARAGVATIVIGLETIAGPQEAEAICRILGSARVIFSLDMKRGRPLGGSEFWRELDAYSIAVQVIGFGIHRLIVLDLARVGLGTGLGTEELCRRIANAHPGVEITGGGGIQGPADLGRLAKYGVHSVLIASALHDGRLRPEHWQAHY